jgi:hypothetical protein
VGRGWGHQWRKVTADLSNHQKSRGTPPWNPPSKGVLPLWTPQNGVWVVSFAGVVLTLKCATLKDYFLGLGTDQTVEGSLRGA